MKIDGQCHCGHVSYQADIDPERVTICHCTDCQMLTGSPYRISVAASRDCIVMTGQAPKTYVKVAENGRKRLQLFCPECGSPLFTTGEGADAEHWGIRWGSIRQRRELPPTRQIWRRSELPWIDHVGELPGKQTG